MCDQCDYASTSRKGVNIHKQCVKLKEKKDQIPKTVEDNIEAAD